MAYNAIPTITTGDVATASWGNTYLKDNFAAGVPDIFTTDGDMAVGTGANTAERVSVMDSSNLVKRDRGGLEVALSAPGADRILFWDHTATDYAYLTAGTNLTISGTTITAASAPTEATQSDMEDEGTTNADRMVSPEIIKYSPGITKVWVMIDANGTIETPNYGMSSVGDTGTGNRRCNFSTAFSTTKFGKQVTGDVAAGGERASGVSSSATDAMIYNSSNVLADSETFFSAWGDQG